MLRDHPLALIHTRPLTLRAVQSKDSLMPALPAPEALKEKVKLVALQIGVREAARQFELSEERVMKWSQRGNWFKNDPQVAEALALKEERQGVSVAVRKCPSEIVLRYGERTKLKLARTTYKTSNALSKLPEEKLLDNTAALVNTVNAAAKLHNWQAPANQTLVNINLTGQRFDRAE